MVAGIYQIWNTVTGDKFIGSSTAIEQVVTHYIKGLREYGKFFLLNDPFATECKLAVDWRLYGEVSFRWGILKKLSGTSHDISLKCIQFCREVRPTYNSQDYLPLVSGVYRILNISTGQCYIGQSKDIYMRWYQHEIALKRNSSPHKALQQSFNEYGAENFKFEVLEECFADKGILLLLEKSWIARTACLYNGK